MSGNYPPGAEYSPKAPFNVDVVEPKDIKVTVSVTISKTVSVKVSDYKEDRYLDEDGNPCVDYDYSDCNLEDAVRQQIALPENSREFNDWCVDDFEVVKE